MARKTVQLHGLRGNYKNDYKPGHVVYRKYKKQWLIYISFVAGYSGNERTIKAYNSIDYVEANADLKEALQKAGKPLSTINDKEDNNRIGMMDIKIHYDDRTANIIGHTITGATIKDHKETMRLRKEHYEKMNDFAVFLRKPKD